MKYMGIPSSAIFKINDRNSKIFGAYTFMLICLIHPTYVAFISEHTNKQYHES